MLCLIKNLTQILTTLYQDTNLTTTTQGVYIDKTSKNNLNTCLFMYIFLLLKHNIYQIYINYNILYIYNLDILYNQCYYFNYKRGDIMESLTTAISVQVDRKDKELATGILNNLGLNMSTYVNMAIKQLINKDGVPFEVVNPRPSKELLKALQEGEDILNGKVKAKSYTNMYEMLKDLKS